MAEQLHSHDKHTGISHEQLISKEQQKHNQELAIEKARKALKQHEQQDHRQIAKEVTQHAKETTRQAFDTPSGERDNDAALPGIQQSIKNKAYYRELNKIQTKLSGTSRKFSKIIHNKTIESVSNIGAQSVARPSGVLGGSIVACIGSFVTYYMARHYGFRYNYLLLFLLFVAGFLLGGILEFCIWLALGRRRR